MKDLSETELRSLVRLLDDEDPRSLELVESQILSIGDPVLPFLDELRGSCAANMVTRIESLSRALRFRRLKADLAKFAVSPDPDLETGVLLICRFGYPNVDQAAYRRWLDHVAETVHASLPADHTPYDVMQRLNAHVFNELGFSGNQDRYYDPDNSFLNRVVDTRRGNPAVLSVLYLLLGRRLGLPVHGVSTPGHFLVGFREPNGTSFFIDAFHKGKLLTVQDVRRMLVRTGYKFMPEYLDRASSRDILLRILRNLVGIYQKTGAIERVEMLSTLIETLQTGKSRRRDL